MERDELRALRPLLPITNFESTSELERFQNDNLRPVIKMQHELLLGLFHTHPLAKNICQSKGPRIEFQNKVRDLIAGQTALKNQLIGMISAMLTSSEFQFYLTHHTELNKRISTMVSQRISDTLY